MAIKRSKPSKSGGNTGDTKQNVDAKAAWGGGLGARTAKNSIKTVFFNFKEYACFFAALFLIQSVFWILCFMSGTNMHNEEKRITSLYDYHLLVEGLSRNDAERIEERLAVNYIQKNSEIAGYKKIPPDEYNDYYSLRVKLRNGGSLDSFVAYYIENIGIERDSVRISPTPLYSYTSGSAAGGLGSGMLAALLLTLLAVLLLMTLYNIRINHFKFLYGIYMTCGAGFRKLFSSALWEMLVISASTLPLSFLVSYLLCLAIYSPVGSAVYIFPWMIPAFAVLNFLSVYFAVRAPMKHMAKKPPVSLIVAQDNSNFVSSPRRSFWIFNKSFPYHYELFSTWRYRRYFARTLITAVIFTSVFICGIYLARIASDRLDDRAPEVYVTVDIAGEDIGDESFDLEAAYSFMDTVIGGFIRPVSGVSHALWENKSPATVINSHIFFGRGTTRGVSEYALKTTGSEVSGTGYEYATNIFDYVACDRQYIDTLLELYEIEGDPYAVLEDSGKIIISDTVYNERQFYFKPGDKIYAATYKRPKSPLSGRLYTDHIDYLRELLEKCAYEYTLYEVAAVVHGGGGGEYFMVGMNYSEYYDFTGADEVSGSVGIWLDEGLRAEAAAGIVNNLKLSLRRGLDGMLTDFFVSDNYSALRAELSASRRSDAAIRVVSLILLFLSPVVWFFSQILFYIKREKEIGLLRMFGARENGVRRLYSFAGLVMAALSILATLALSFSCSYLLYKLLNGFLPKYGFIEGMRHAFYLSPWALLVSLILSVACGFFSSYIPSQIGRRRRKKEYARQFSGER